MLYDRLELKLKNQSEYSIHSDLDLSNETGIMTQEGIIQVAEPILKRLASLIIKNKWTVFDVFGSLIYTDKDNSYKLTIRNLLGRIYQVGITNLT